MENLEISFVKKPWQCALYRPVLRLIRYTDTKNVKAIQVAQQEHSRLCIKFQELFHLTIFNVNFYCPVTITFQNLQFWCEDLVNFNFDIIV